MSQSASQNNQTTKDTPETVTVPANGMEKLDLGEYPTEKAVPVFSYDFIPDRHEFISVDEKRIHTRNGVHVVVHFQNYGDVATLVSAQPLVGQ